jgi:DNA-3-methyladenine glycosylase I
MQQVPSKSQEAENMSKALKQKGFKFVGPTMTYAMMQAVGMVNDHTLDCFRYEQVKAIGRAMEWPDCE